MQRCPDPDATAHYVFVTVESPTLAGVDVSRIPLPTLRQEMDRITGPLFRTIISNLYGSDNNFMMWVLFQPGIHGDHPHLHIIINQRMTPRSKENRTIFDQFAALFRDPVLKSAWGVDGLIKYLLKPGSVIISCFGDPDISFGVDDVDNPDIPAPKKSFNLRKTVQTVLNRNPTMSCASLHNTLLRTNFEGYRSNTVNEAFQNWW